MRWITIITITLLTCGAAGAAAATQHPRPDLLLEPAELARPENAKRFRILDVRERKSFDESRIPLAQHIDPAAWSKAFGDGRDVEGWSKRIGNLAIDDNTPVVIYDDAAFKDAGRIWWILRYWGIKEVRLLNGGWKGWSAAKLSVETAKPAAFAPATIRVKPLGQRLATKSQVLDMLKAGEFQIVDARTEGEHCGTKNLAKRGGAIPSAKHLDWVDLVDQSTHRFKGPDELLKLFKEANIDPSKPTVTYCQSGGRASVMAFGLELMGAKDVRNYYASWADWGNDATTPVVPGKPKMK